MALILRKLLNNVNKRYLYNNLKLTSRHYSAYEGDGKTSIQILNTEIDGGLMINSYSQYGFRLNNDMVIIGPMAIFPRSVLQWNVNDYQTINEETLSLFCLLEPKLDVLVIGIGDQTVTPALSKHILQFIRKYNINIELLTTEQACTTFNFLNAENRIVAGALIPPMHVKINENDILKSQLRNNSLFGVSD